MSAYLRSGNPLSWDEAMELIHKGRGNKKKLASNLYLIYEPLAGGSGHFEIKLYDTVIAKLFIDGGFKIYTGGWNTHLTRKRIREFTDAPLYMKKGELYIEDGEAKIPFEEGMEISFEMLERRRARIEKIMQEPLFN